jgi:hypothetical protein
LTLPAARFSLLAMLAILDIIRPRRRRLRGGAGVRQADR